jgi:hypothetical protein
MIVSMKYIALLLAVMLASAVIAVSKVTSTTKMEEVGTLYLVVHRFR